MEVPATPVKVPVRPRAAASVVLVRDGSDPDHDGTTLQVFMLRRAHSMAFAPGMTVFPGGGVHATDFEVVDSWVGPEPDWWGTRFGVDPDLAGALVHAAIRELVEECGILLTDVALDQAWLNDARIRLDAHSSSLAAVLTEQRLGLRADLLRPWARWITPEHLPIRYDTVFFVARLPSGQAADGLTREATAAGWVTPSDALQGFADGRVHLLNPTHQTLLELATHRVVEELWSAAATRRPSRADGLYPG